MDGHQYSIHVSTIQQANINKKHPKHTRNSKIREPNSFNVVDDERYELFREMMTAVVITAVAYDHWQSVGMMVSSHQMIARCFACTIGASWIIGSGL